MQPGVLLARSWRNGRVQAVHTGHAVLLAPDGTVRRAWGDPATGTYWRSCAKPIQALAFAAGPVDALGLDDRSVAVACGSHEAEPVHIAEALRILRAAGLGESALRCAAHDVEERHAGPRPPGGWTAIHNNCSGKHAAMLAVCVARGWPTDSYLDPQHPLQQEVLAAMRRLTRDADGGGDGEVPFGVDGCGLPTYWTSIAAIARAFQRLRHEPAGPRVLDAMAAHPLLVGGTSRTDTLLAQATQGRVLAKIGALGVHVALDRRSGAALAVKVADGASQPRDAVTLELLRQAGWLTEAELAPLREHHLPTLTNHAGRVVGHLEPCPEG